MAQTAVEWLLKAQFELIFDKGMSKRQYLAKRVRIEKQAKQMEKEQIMRAAYDAMSTNFDPNMGRAELYYNETYKNNNPISSQK